MTTEQKKRRADERGYTRSILSRARDSCENGEHDGHERDCELAQLLTENGREVRYAE